MTKVKICGLFREEDIQAANQFVPDYVGFVLAPSRRQVSPSQAQVFRQALDPQISAVGVFVNEQIEAIVDLYESNTIDIVQLHGDEDVVYIDRLKQACNCPVIKAVGVSDRLSSLSDMSSLLDLPSLISLSQHADYLLFDTYNKPPAEEQCPAGASAAYTRGGTGRAFDLSLLEDYSGPPYFLAGGINAANVAAAIKSLSPYCVDVSSGVETNGQKDRQKIAAFIELVRKESAL
ncbi:MAG: phosphoribosylanthranilate isomerase [Coriobacteriia bacterium]|nr:phosphoribosylanthranilate isomerase [Coriobacteriia bacterium]MCL2137123.1 phosphoribosylanthranilate isomerase [Coriobacteriia bacterium]